VFGGQARGCQALTREAADVTDGPSRHPPANERNPSPLIPLPIGWGEGDLVAVDWHHAAPFCSSDSP